MFYRLLSVPLPFIILPIALSVLFCIVSGYSFGIFNYSYTKQKSYWNVTTSCLKDELQRRKNNCGVTISVHKYIQSNVSFMTFQGNNEIWSDKTGGHIRQV
jgi:hypothetical protein